MCNKIDNNVTIFRCIKALKVLYAIAIIWLLISIAILASIIFLTHKILDVEEEEYEKQGEYASQKFFYKHFYDGEYRIGYHEAIDPKKREKGRAAFKQIAYIFAFLAASEPFTIAILIFIGNFTKCGCLYIFAAILSILNIIEDIPFIATFFMVSFDWWTVIFAISVLFGLVLNGITIYSMFAVTCCQRNQIQNENENPNKKDLETNTVSGTTI
ncbi:unnamed protein product [Caenorhabditis angaria]|uniref:Uncharacterized protein n=1 Tax=Caenorhabditis angaria TaxID=860376 RepID=A0A9P1MVN8_9PELO|nr:unnamed protein product [Caenorhabditis angaria]